MVDRRRRGRFSGHFLEAAEIGPTNSGDSTCASAACLPLESAPMTDFQNRIVGIVGRKGSGKSTRTASLLKYVRRIIVWDPMADHRPLLPDSIEGLRDELEDYLDEAYIKKTFACSYVPGDELEWEFDEVCALVYDFGNL